MTIPSFQLPRWLHNVASMLLGLYAPFLLAVILITLLPTGARFTGDAPGIQEPLAALVMAITFIPCLGIYWALTRIVHKLLPAVEAAPFGDAPAPAMVQFLNFTIVTIGQGALLSLVFASLFALGSLFNLLIFALAALVFNQAIVKVFLRLFPRPAA